jgi:hypothetical protein
MRYFCRTLVASAAALLTCAPATHASRVHVDLNACRPMIGLLRAMHDGAPRDSVDQALESLIETPAYRVMFRHYNRSWRPNHLPPGVFQRMILSLAYSGEYAVGENQRADSMLTRWRAAYDDVPRCERQLTRLEAANMRALADRGVKYAQGWLPPGWTIPDFDLIVLPQGGSPAFSIDGTQGYDFFQIPVTASGDLDIDWLVGTIAHESNHLGMRGPRASLAVASDSVALALVALCVPEGVATEFISGPPPGRVPAVPGVPYHLFTPALSQAWNARVEEEPDMMAHMAKLLDRAAHDSLSQGQLEADMRDYWFEGAIGRAYVFGSEMLGAIELGLGRKAVFEAIEDPRRMFELYDRAIATHSKELARCVPVPDSTVRQSLDIGADRPAPAPGH